MPERIPITVLLSSYNGEKYIEEQINSILSQKDVELHLTVRDDGSTDGTPQILKRMQSANANITVSLGENVGVIQSFFELIKLSPNRSDYYALSDQDDVWNADKLFTAISELKRYQPGQPLLYCAAVEYVDQNLQHLRMSDNFSIDQIGFDNALVQNIATGCTIVLNQSAKLKIAEKLPQHCVMHDWWMYLVISAFGTIVYDAMPALKYRQHNQNVLGVAPTYRIRMKRRLNRLLNPDSVKISTQLSEFYRLFGKELNAAQQRQMQRVLNCNSNFFSRLRLIASRDFHRQNRFDDVLIRLLMLIGKF